MQELFYSKIGIYYRINDFLPGRETLVFIHGLSGSSSAWVKYEQKFQNGYNLLSFDLRGHGKSVRPKRYKDYAVERSAEDLNELLVYLRIEKCIIVAHSFGTLVALLFLVHNFSKVSSVIFLATNVGVQKLLIAKLTRPLLAVFTLLSFPFPIFKKSGGQIDYAKYPDTPDWSIRRIAADVRNTGVRAYLFALRHIFKFNDEAWWSRMGVPVLMIHGEKDTYIPVKNAIALSNRLINSKLRLLKNANHILILNNFAEVSAAMEDFIKR